MARFYHRDDVGAPALTYVSTTYNRAGFDALKLILKACLVYGYGSRPAAGWELVNEGANFLVLRNGTHDGYVCFTMSAATTVTVYLAATYTGMAGDVMQGDGLKTGAAANNAIPQRLSLWAVAYAASSSTWYVVADEKTCIVQMAGGTAATELAVTGTLYTAGFYFGNDDSGHFIAIGGTNTVSTSSTSALDVFSHEGMTILQHPGTGFLVGSTAAFPQTPSLYTGGNADSSDISRLAEVPLTQAVWGEFSLHPYVAGRLRGIVQTPALIRSYVSKAAQSLGFPGAMTTRNLNTPIDLEDGHVYLLGGNYAVRTHTRLVTTNPEFW